MTHNSRYEKIQNIMLQALNELSFEDFLSIDKFSVADYKQMFQFWIGRFDCRRFNLKPLGGRKSRIQYIIQKLTLYPVFSESWHQSCEEIEEKFAKSTVMKALKLLLN